MSHFWKLYALIWPQLSTTDLHFRFNEDRSVATKKRWECDSFISASMLYMVVKNFTPFKKCKTTQLAQDLMQGDDT